ncbi:MAG TPA: hypothetical protein VMV71_01550 [Candidatus Paceibacterota bacterium]|nr:hypothetical protein [Candidatus Paceibacterota bacterium]
MNSLIVKYSFIFLTVLVFIFPSSSMAEVSFQSTMSSPSGVNDIFNNLNLPAPLTDFINSTKDIGSSLNNEVGKYISTSPIKIPSNFSISQVNQLNLTQWLQNAAQNSSLSGIYSIVIKMVKAVGNLALWMLGIVTDLIRQGLSLIH